MIDIQLPILFEKGTNRKRLQILSDGTINKLLVPIDKSKFNLPLDFVDFIVSIFFLYRLKRKM